MCSFSHHWSLTFWGQSPRCRFPLSEVGEMNRGHSCHTVAEWLTSATLKVMRHPPAVGTNWPILCCRAVKHQTNKQNHGRHPVLVLVQGIVNYHCNLCCQSFVKKNCMPKSRFDCLMVALFIEPVYQGHSLIQLIATHVVCNYKHLLELCTFIYRMFTHSDTSVSCVQWAWISYLYSTHGIMSGLLHDNSIGKLYMERWVLLISRVNSTQVTSPMYMFYVF